MLQDDPLVSSANLSGRPDCLLPLRRFRSPIVRMPTGSRDVFIIQIQKLVAHRYRGYEPNTAPVILITSGDTHPYHCPFFGGSPGAPQLTKDRVYYEKSSLCCYRVGDCQEVGPRPNF
jgi:hypothetical protein